MTKNKAIIKTIILVVFFVMVILFYNLRVSLRATSTNVFIMLVLIALGLISNIYFLKSTILNNKILSELTKTIIDWVGFITISVVTIISFLTFIASTSVVEGNSMNPTLKHGDFLIVYHFNYKPSHNDLIIIKRENDYLVKRLIALPGDSINLVSYGELHYKIYLNDSLVAIKDGSDNDYLIYKEDVKVLKEGKNILSNEDIFILGDNNETRSSSSDSKQNGYYNINNIIGKVKWNVNG